MAKLPQIDYGGTVQKLGVIDPSTAAAPGRAVARLGGQIAGAAQQVAVAHEQEMVKRDLHASKLAEFDIRKKNAELLTELNETPYLSADDPRVSGLPDVPVTADGQVRTSDVAAQIYAQQNQAWRSEHAGSMREGRLQDEWLERMEVSATEQAAKIQQQSFKIARDQRRAETGLMVDDLVQNQDYEGALHQVRVAKAEHTLSDIEAAKANKAIYLQREVDGVENAILQRDPSALERERQRLTDEEYSGELTLPQRNAAVARIRTAQKSIAAEAEAGAAASNAIARRDAGRAVSRVLDGDLRGLTDLANMDMAGIYSGDLSDTELKELDEINFVVENAELIAGIAQGRPGAMAEAREKGLSAHWMNKLEQMNEKAQAAMDDDALGRSEQVGIIEPLPEFDYDDISGSMSRYREASEKVFKLTGRRAAMPQEVADTLARGMQNLTPGEQVQVLQEISTGLGGDVDLMHDVAMKLGAATDGAEWTTMKLLQTTGDQRVATRQIEGRQALADDDMAPLLEKKGYDADGVTSELLEDVYSVYPVTGGDMLTAAQELTAGYILSGMSQKDALKRAKAVVLGGRIQYDRRGESSVVGGGVVTGLAGEKVMPPTPGMSRREFRRVQRASGPVLESLLPGHGYELATKTVDGEIEWRNWEEQPGNYYMVYKAGGRAVLDTEGKLLTFSTEDIDPDAPAFVGVGGD